MGIIFLGTEDDAYLSNGFTSLPPDGFTFRSEYPLLLMLGGQDGRILEPFKEQDDR